MSCDHRRKVGFAALVEAGLAGNLTAEDLERRFQTARGAPANEQESTIARMKTEALFATWRAAGLAVPTKSTSGLPRAEAQRGYAAILDIIKDRRARGASGPPAQEPAVLRLDDDDFVQALAEGPFPTQLTAPALFTRVAREAAPAFAALLHVQRAHADSCAPIHLMR